MSQDLSLDVVWEKVPIHTPALQEEPNCHLLWNFSLYPSCIGKKKKFIGAAFSQSAPHQDSNVSCSYAHPVLHPNHIINSASNIDDT